MKLSLVVRLVAGFLLAISLNACADKNPWQGDYLYEAALGENLGGDQMVVSYGLHLQGTSCTLDIEGYQVSESIVCSANADGDSLIVSFKSYADGSVKNIYDVAVYPVGGPLFSLKSSAKGLVTQWQNLEPDNTSVKEGAFFVRKP